MAHQHPKICPTFWAVTRPLSILEKQKGRFAHFCTKVILKKPVIPYKFCNLKGHNF